MTSENDAEFLDSMEQWVIGSLVFKREHRERLFALARRGAAAEFLFGLLDDIDTADDMAKSNEAVYREMVRKLHRRRFEVASTDGYTVTFLPLPPQENSDE